MFFFFLMEGHNNWVEGVEREGYIQEIAGYVFPLQYSLKKLFHVLFC